MDSRSGTGQAVENSWGITVFYTTVDGDSFDSLGYQFRVGTAEIRQYNPSLVEMELIPAGTKLRMIAGYLPLERTSGTGTYTADAEGIPLTYTTVAGDTEAQLLPDSASSSSTAPTVPPPARAGPGTNKLFKLRYRPGDETAAEGEPDD